MSDIKVGTNIQTIIGVVFTALALLASHAHADSLSVRTDRQKIGIDDTFILIIRSADASMFDSPDLSALEQDFTLLGTSRSSQTSVTNGKVESSLEWQVSLAPKREGALVIPPIKVKDELSKPLVVQVTPSARPKSAGGFEPVFVESELDQESVYVQSQLILTVKIHYAIPLARGARLSELEIPNAVVKQINEAAFETRLANKNYNVHEVTYAIFPQRSGKLEIPPQTFNATVSKGRRGGSIFEPFGSQVRGRPVRAQSSGHSVDIKPKVAEFKGQHWLPAKSIDIIESWSKNLDQLKAGEPITRSLIVEAVGLQGSQVPPLNVPDVEDAQQYPDQPETSDEDSSFGVTGTRIESLAIIPAGGGELVLPEIVLPWWNTRTNQQEYARLPEQTIRVSGPPLVKRTPSGATGIDPTNAVNQTSSNGVQPLAANPFWKIATWLALALWLGTVFYFTRMRGTSTNLPAAKIPSALQTRRQSLQEVKEAVDGGDARTIKRALIQWARKHTDKQNLSSLASISAHFQYAGLDKELQALDSALYTANGKKVDGKKIVLALEKALIAEEKRRPRRAEPELEPLYKV